MAIKIDKTKREFVEGMVEDLPASWSRGERRIMAAAMVSALDLEFREEERGEGVPERVEIGPHHEGGWALWSEEDVRDLNQAIVKGHGPIAFVPGPRSRAEAVRDAYNRGQDFPNLLALARELEGELQDYLRSFGSDGPDTDALLSRARDLLDRLEGGRE